MGEFPLFSVAQLSLPLFASELGKTLILGQPPELCEGVRELPLETLVEGADLLRSQLRQVAPGLVIPETLQQRTCCQLGIVLETFNELQQQRYAGKLQRAQVGGARDSASQGWVVNKPRNYLPHKRRRLSFNPV